MTLPTKVADRPYVDALVSALQAGQAAGVIGYATQALLFADLAHPDGSVGYVTNDPTPANNGTYRKNGASGAGAWVQSSFDRVLALENRMTPVEAKTAPIDVAVVANYGEYEWALVDQNGRIGIGVKTDGTVVGKIQDLPRIVTLEGKTASTDVLVSGAYGEYEWAIVDQNGVVALGVKTDGSVVGKFLNPLAPSVAENANYVACVVVVAGKQQIRVINKTTWAQTVVTTSGNNRRPTFTADGVNIIFTTDRNGLEEFYYVAVAGGAEQPLLPSLDLSFIGDSLTVGTGASDSAHQYPTLVAAALARAFKTYAIGGQQSKQIAVRLGALNTTVRVAGASIAAGANSVTHLAGVAIAPTNAKTGIDPQWLSTPADNTTRTALCTLNGIKGTMTRTAVGGPPSTGETYSFKPIPGTPGLPAACPDDSPLVVDSLSIEKTTMICWVGSNDFTNPAQVEADITALYNYFKPLVKRILFLTPIDLNRNAADQTGGANYNNVLAIKNWLAANYPNNYVDVWTPLLDGTGVIAAANYDVPSGHPSDAGYAIVANTVINFLTPKGW
jgi:hypothetical protein